MKKREVFTTLIRKRQGDSVTPIESDIKPKNDYYEYEDDNREPKIVPYIEDFVDLTSKTINQ